MNEMPRTTKAIVAIVPILPDVCTNRRPDASYAVAEVAIQKPAFGDLCVPIAIEVRWITRFSQVRRAGEQFS